jgi:hypothetical protein
MRLSFRSRDQRQNEDNAKVIFKLPDGRDCHGELNRLATAAIFLRGRIDPGVVHRAP